VPSPFVIATWIAFLQGETGDDSYLLDHALQDKQVLMPPVVLAELVSDPKLDPKVVKALCGVPLMRLLRAFGNGRADCERRYSAIGARRVWATL
jgi:hypothetical protein